MSIKQLSLFDSQRLTHEQSMEMTLDSLRAYAPDYRHWVLAYSGGKDSSATLAIVVHLLASGALPRPDSLTICYADTRMELPPLHASALRILGAVSGPRVATRIVLPDLDHRYFVYMFGRGVPPPTNTFRWCTQQLKIDPITRAQEGIAIAAGMGEYVWDERFRRDRYHGNGAGKLLLLTGVRQGESAARDQRIAVACSKNGSECGQGWFHQTDKHALYDTLAPILHWRVCHVWDLLTFLAPKWGIPTADIADIYGGEEKEEINARTGCIGCNLAQRDVALDTILARERWAYLAALKGLRPLYRHLRLPEQRLRKQFERRKDGSIRADGGTRMGPLTMEARRAGVAEVLRIQREVNEHATTEDRPPIDLLNREEHARIQDVIGANTWPDGWDGTEPRADLAEFGRGGQMRLLAPGGSRV